MTNEYEASIRITDQSGDYDSLSEIHLIGPYMDSEEADEEIERMEAIPGVIRNLGLRTSNLSSGSMLDPGEIAKTTSLDEIEKLMFSVQP